MRSDSALGLQAEIFTRIFDFIELPEIGSSDAPSPGRFIDPELLERKSLRPRRPRWRAVEDIALGVSEPADGEEAQLAVLAQSRRALQSPLIERILDIARGEAEIVYIGRQRPLWTSERNDPLRLGSSISPVTVPYAGTLGCFGRDDSTGRRGIVSNNHVLADVNSVAIGTRIMQPGARDGGRPGADDIAELLRFVPVQFGGIPNRVDAAFAALVEHGRGEEPDVLVGSEWPPVPALTVDPSAVSEPLPGLVVAKTGRTTGHTRGRVAAVNVSNFLVDMGAGVARFDGQIVIETEAPPQPFSRPGDSGALIVDEAGAPLGLLFSGSASGGAGNVGITGANPISSLTRELGVTLI